MWTETNTEEFLSLNPLPARVQWPDTKGVLRSPLPTKPLVQGFGHWVRMNGNLAGLFDLVHAILADSETNRGDAEWLADDIQKRLGPDGLARLSRTRIRQYNDFWGVMAEREIEWKGRHATDRN